jgi:type I restriction enzyme M protein
MGVLSSRDGVRVPNRKLCKISASQASRIVHKTAEEIMPPKLGNKGLLVLEKAVRDLDPDGKFVELDVAKKLVSYSTDIITHEAISQYVGEEEPSRAYLVAWLCTVGGYLPSNLELEKRYQIGRPKRTGSGAELDILINHADGTPFALVEVKEPEEYEVNQDKFIRGQLFNLAPLEVGCSVLAYTTVELVDGSIRPHTITIAYESADKFETWAINRPASGDLPRNYGEPIHVHLEKGTENDLRNDVSIADLDRLRKRMHNVLWRGSTPDNQVYDYVVRLFLAKIYDEKTREQGERYKFQIFYSGNDRETAEDTFARINELFVEAYDRYLNLDGSSPTETLNEREFSAEQIAFVVELMQRISLTSSNDMGGDLLGSFFEGITRDGFKQTKGLFFTHPNVVAFVLKVLDLEELALDRIRAKAVYSERLPYIIDPSCGSGTFLMMAMKLVSDEVDRQRSKIARNDDIRDFLNEKLPKDHPNLWAKDFLFGIDATELLAMATKVNMVLHRDGNTHIYHSDGLSPLSTYVDQRLKSRERTDSGYDRPVAESFDIVVTNPPFSIALDPQTLRHLDAAFELAGLKNSENLFLERWYQLLKPGARLGAVMPESFFSTQENLPARLFLFDHFFVRAVVSLPRHAFEPWTPTRTSLLFAQKKTTAEEEEWIVARRSETTTIENAYRAAIRSLRTAIRHANGESVSAKTLSKASTELKSAGPILGVDFSEVAGLDQAEELVTSLLIRILAMDPTQMGFARVAEKFGYEFPLMTVSNIGYKRTRRSEYRRMNDLFVASSKSQNGDRVTNLNMSPNDWVIEAVDAGSDAYSQLVAARIWK